MPGYRGHIAGAAVAGGVYTGVLESIPSHQLTNAHGILSSWQLPVGLMVIAILFGLFPDVDTNSKGQNIFYGLALAADGLLIITGHVEAAAFLGLAAMTPALGKHRGWTHSRLAMILVPSPFIIMPYLYDQRIWNTGLIIYGAAVTGYFSHLLLDGKIFKHFRVRGASR